jgi:hypothetical protein
MLAIKSDKVVVGMFIGYAAGLLCSQPAKKGMNKSGTCTQVMFHYKPDPPGFCNSDVSVITYLKGWNGG